MAKKDLEKQEYDFQHSGEFCERCNRELSETELKYISDFGGQKLCSDCRADWDKIQKE